VKHIRITAKGRKMLAAGSRLREQVERSFFAPLTDSEKASLDRLLSKLLK
jgi:DNA-binding MarR family transcriptional regulator